MDLELVWRFGDLFGPCTAGGVLEVAKHHSQNDPYMVCDDIRYIDHVYAPLRYRALEKISAEHHASYSGRMQLALNRIYIVA